MPLTPLCTMPEPNLAGPYLLSCLDGLSRHLTNAKQKTWPYRVKQNTAH